MAQPIDPNAAGSNPASASNPEGRPSRSVEKVYQQAVAAFKGQKYDQALGLFQRLGQLPPSSPYYIKALMGQVRAHQRLGRGDQAGRLCQPLLNSSSTQARQWAQQVLSQLAQEPQPDPATRQNPESAAGDSAGTDLSGFVPLEAPTSSPQRPASLPPQSADLPPVQVSPPQASEVLAKPTGNASGANASGANDAEESPSDSVHRSLFHFQQLNRQSPGVEQADHELPIPRPPSPPNQANMVDSQPASHPAQKLKLQTQKQTALPQRPLSLWLGQGGTAIALLWAINWAFHAALRTLDIALRWVRWPVRLSLPGAYQSYTPWIVGAAVLLALASPWMMDYALAFWHRQQPLSLRQLQAKHPDVLRLLRQVCRQQDWQLPELRLIPDPAPLCFSYGWLPGNSRIVVSQGLLDRCSDQALTALYSYELARMINGSLPVLSAVGLPLLLLHTGYRWLAQVGDGLSQPLIRNLLGIGASLFYGLFWLLRQLVLWLSRLCGSWGDRRTVALTRHPDHLSEGLLELTEAIAAHLQQRGTLHPLHSSLEILMPVSSRQAITPGGLLASALETSTPEIIAPESRTSLSKLLMTTEGLNPYRQWLRINASHIPLGERLLWLNQQSLLLGQPGIAPQDLLPASPPQVSLPLLFLQKGPLVGLLLGGGLSMGLWFLGGIVNRLGWQRLSWLYQDPSILWGGLWLGLGLGLLLRIDTLFPEAQGQPRGADVTTVATLLQSTSPLPVRGQPVTLRGTLRGSPGLGNWGCQDLYLEDSSGFVRLINPVPLGRLQGWRQSRSHPQGWIGRRVTATGWGRHGGGMLWVDIHQIQLDQRHQFTTYGPIWAKLISLGSGLIGIGIIFRGG